MGLAHRRHARQKVKSLVCVDLGPSNGGLLLDLSEGGLSFSAVSPMLKNQPVQVHCKLGPTGQIEGRGEIVWLEEAGKRGGVRFTELSETSRRQIRKWIALQSVSGEAPAETATPPPAIGKELPRPPARHGATAPPTPGTLEGSPVSQVQDRPVAQQAARVERPEKPAAAARPETPKPASPVRPAHPRPIDQPRRASPPARPRVVTLPVPTRSSTVPAPQPVRDPSELPDVTPAEVQSRAEQAARDEQRFRRMILTGIAGCVAGLALAAVVVLFPYLAEHIGGAFREPATAPPSTATPSGASGTGAADVSRPARRSYASQIEITDSYNRRWVLTPRSNALKGIWSMGAIRPAVGTKSKNNGSSGPNGSSSQQLGARSNSASVSSQEEIPRHVVLAPTRSAQGALELQILIGRDGRVHNVRVISGPPTLTPAVIETVRQWRYHGSAVEAYRRITIDYALAAK